jgi:hypothetical protein
VNVHNVATVIRLRFVQAITNKFLNFLHYFSIPLMRVAWAKM